MTEVVYYFAASVDGYIATPDGGVEWLARFESAGEDYGYSDFYASIDSVLLGRKTYEQSLTFGPWPYPGKPCWVFTHRKVEPAAADVRMTSSSPLEVVTDLQRKGYERSWLVGGAELAGAFRKTKLISEYVVSIIPIILGNGIPMLALHGSVDRLELVETRPFPNGLVQLRYRSSKTD
jgi:dihydrofolate reductase